jgi:hypothetical protein
MRDARVWLREIAMAAALVALQAAGAAAVQPCPIDRNCAAAAIDSPSQPAAPGDTVLIGLTVEQGADDQQSGGIDDVAALTITIGIPTLVLADCSAPGSDGLNPSFVPLPGAASGYRIVVQNLTCAGRSSCLCPTAGEPRDEYINLLLVGTVGAAGVEPLPSGELLGIAVHVPSGAAASTVPLHIFSALDELARVPHPAAGTWLSIADSRAVDLTVDAASATLNVRVTDGEIAVSGSTPTPLATGTASATASLTATATATASQQPSPPVTATATATAAPAIATATVTVTAAATATTTASATETATSVVTGTATPPPCVGDCDHSEQVTINELIVGVDIVLGTLPPAACPEFECLGRPGEVDITCLIAAVNAAQNGCPGQTAP